MIWSIFMDGKAKLRLRHYKSRKDKNFWEYYIVILGYWIKFAPL